MPPLKNTSSSKLFQLTAARRRLDKHNAEDVDSDMVSTHSRPKAAGVSAVRPSESAVRFNSQPPEGGWVVDISALMPPLPVSTHSRPKAAGHQACPKLSYR